MPSRALASVLLEGGIIADQETPSKLKGSDQSGTSVLLSWQTMEKVGESGDAAEDPRLVRVLAQ